MSALHSNHTDKGILESLLARAAQRDLERRDSRGRVHFCIHCETPTEYKRLGHLRGVLLMVCRACDEKGRG